MAHYFNVLAQNSQILAKKVPNFGTELGKNM